MNDDNLCEMCGEDIDDNEVFVCQDCGRTLCPACYVSVMDKRCRACYLKATLDNGITLKGEQLMATIELKDGWTVKPSILKSIKEQSVYELSQEEIEEVILLLAKEQVKL